jgi:nitronate monooxygenase
VDSVPEASSGLRQRPRFLRRSAETAGADAIVAQGMGAGGHRGAFDAAKAEVEMVGLFSLLPAVVDAVNLPVIATGGIAEVLSR